MPGYPRRSPLLLWLTGLLVLCALLVASAFLYVELAERDRAVSVDRAPRVPLAVVFGAGLGPQGEASPVLAARVKTAVELYRAGKVDRVLLSGSSERHHDELRAMRRLAESAG